jgi:hypothetical protein
MSEVDKPDEQLPNEIVEIDEAWLASHIIAILMYLEEKFGPDASAISKVADVLRNTLSKVQNGTQNASDNNSVQQ